MSKNSEAVKKWRKETKKRIIESMGGCCQICGYNRCNSSLALHHINPNEKDFNFGKLRANPVSWSKITNELKKCILLCHNCHSEIHDGMTKLPEIYNKFNEEFNIYKEKVESQSPCLICGKLKNKALFTCSSICAGKRAWRVDWNSINLEKELENNTIVAVAEKLNLSDASVRKRMKVLGISKK